MPPFDEYFPFDLGHGNLATSARWRKMARLFMPDGYVMAGADYPGLPPNPTIGGGNITIPPSAYSVHGYYAEITSPGGFTFPVGTNGMVVAAVDLVQEVASIYFKSNALDYKDLTQTNQMWEVPLWLISGTTASWIGNTANPGRALGTAGFVGAKAIPPPTGPGGPGNPFYTLQPWGTITVNFMTFRVSHPSLLFLIGGVQLGLTNPLYVQAALTNIIVQPGLPDEQDGQVTEPIYWPAGGGINPGYPLRQYATMMMLCWVTKPGKTTAGIKVTIGSGPPVELTQLSLYVMQLGSLSNM